MKHLKLVVLLAAMGAAAGSWAESLETKTEGNVGYGIREQGRGIKVSALDKDNNSFHKGKKGDAGLGLMEISDGKRISLVGEKGLFKLLSGTYGSDKNGVVEFGQANEHKPNEPEDHNKGGLLKIAKVANSDVYFGEWSYTGKTTDGSHNVFYVGQKLATDLPKGWVDYDVKGISGHIKNRMLLTGKLSAHFAQGKVEGMIANPRLKVIITANKINMKDTSFSGPAYAAGALVKGKPVDGNVAGHFFGKGATAIGGIVTFDKRRDLDTAFGGVKK